MLNWLKQLRDNYVIRHADSIRLPAFAPDKTVRKRVILIGRVQKVGFRLEISCLARRLGLTGWVKNRPEGSVETELQGEASKIDFLIHTMESLKRASIRKKQIEDLPLTEWEKDFTVLK